jgi:hypothetical protein
MPGFEEETRLLGEEIAEGHPKDLSEMDKELDTLRDDLELYRVRTQSEIYKEALEEILAQEPGLWKTMQRIAAKALGKEYSE